MSAEIYHKLRKHLDQLHGPCPKTETGVEIKILKKLFTPEEAKIAVNLKFLPEQVSAIAARLGMPEAEAAEKLDSMARQGSILRFRAGEKIYYFAIPFVIGVYEFHLNSIDRELAEMMEEYLPVLSLAFAKTKTKQLRVIPVASSVDASLKVETYDQVRELVKKHDLFAVAPCICRKEQSLLGHNCQRPYETCLTFGIGAQYYIENKLGRKISLDECLKILDQAEEHALVLCPTNAQLINNICCCCSCCCGILRGAKLLPKPAEGVTSSYQAGIDPDLCTGCGECIERCQMEAIKEGDQFTIDLDRCIGCGLCINTCPTGAMSLKPKPEQIRPPTSSPETAIKIMKERGII